MWLAEPYPTPPPGIPGMITGYLTGLIPAGVIDTTVAAFFAAVTVVLAALGYHHARRQTWLSGWVSGPVSIVTALIAASYGASGLPDLAGVDPSARAPQTFVVDATVALLAGAVVAGATWPVAAHLAAHRGSPITLADLRDWAQAQRLHAGGGAAVGAALAWIVLGPMLSVAGSVIGVLITGLIEHLRGPAGPATPAPPAAPREHRVVPAPVPPPISDEW